MLMATMSTDNTKLQLDYRPHCTKLCYVTCIACNNEFYVKDVSKLTGSLPKGSRIPLLFDCGHPVCSKCIKTSKFEQCPFCKNDATNVYCNDNQKNLFPLNLHVLGLIASSYHHSLKDNNENFSFHYKLSTQLNKLEKANQGNCHECINRADIKCLQCVALYCQGCYAKIHGRALQSHTCIPIFKNSLDSSAIISSNCSSTCFETLTFFCNECNVACCSTCTLKSHKTHDIMPLSEKNETLLTEFEQVYKDIEDTLLRITNTKEKIKSTLYSNMYEPQNGAAVEASITQHFAYLHGILQNMEAGLIKQLYHQRDSFKNNLMDLEAQLQSQKEILAVTLKMAANARQIFNKVDIRTSISVLKEMMDLPCYLMYKDTGVQNKVTLNIDDSIAKTIEDHCTIQLPPIPFYSLVRKDELPENYIRSPLESPKKLCNKKTFSEPPLEPKAIKHDSTSTSVKSENTKQESISENEVEVMHIVTPSLFFVRKVASKSEFEKFEENLTKYGKCQQEMSPINIGKGDMCIVKLGVHWKKDVWYRGRVNTVYTNCNNKTFYNVFCIDYGIKEYKVPSSRIRHIPEHLQELPPQAIRCCLHGVKPKSGVWTNTSMKDFMKMTSENNCSITMSVIKSTSEILYVDLCVTSSMDNNMGPQSIRNIMRYMNHVHLNNEQSTTQKTTYVYAKEELPLRIATQLIISHIESPDKIYVTKPGQWKDNLLKIMNKLKEYYEKNTSAETIDLPKKGLPCAVQLEDNTWQRGEIVEIINEDKVKVFCVDWGCTVNLNLDCLRVIPLEYTAFNAQAIRISLKYVSPESDGNWKPEAIQLLISTLSNTKYVTVTPYKKIEDRYIGCIFSNNCDISWLLKYKGVVKEFLMNKYKNKSSVKSPQVQNSSKSSKNCDSLNDIEDVKPVEENKIVDNFENFNMTVRVRRMITPDCIYVIQTELEESCAKMISAMQEFYKFHKSEWRDEWNEGALCGVYSAKDKSYFRAKILKIKSPEEVLVYFCDLGIEETVTLKDIQILHQTFTQEAMYCFKVKLAGILPCGGTSTWPSLSCTTLSDILRKNAFCKFYITKPIQEEAYNDVIPVELWVRQTKAPGPFEPSVIEINSINRMLIDEGVALPIKNYFAKMRLTLAAEFKQQIEKNCQFSMIEEEVEWFINFNPDRNETSAKNETTVSNWLPPTEITEKIFYAIPTYVDNNCAIYLHPKKNNADVLKYIESKLQNCFKDVNIEEEKENIEKRWKEGDLCIAKYHLDNKWYRGRIVKNLGRTLQVEFVDYGNIEECEMQYVSDNVKLTDLPIQCTKCVISGLKPATLNGKWILNDLDRIHALLVGQECKVSVLQRQSTHLVISITILRPWKGDLLIYLTNHMDMNIDIEKKLWNCSESTENEDLESNSTDVIIEEIINCKETCVTDTSGKVSLETYTQDDATLNENMISGNLINPLKSFESESDDDIDISDFENISCMDIITLNKALASSTPEEGSIFGDISPYKQLVIPQETKYIELILSFNLTPTTSFGLLAENNDAIFPTIFREYYLNYIAMMSNIQLHADCQPLIKSFEKNTPCIAKFSDNMYYRGIIRRSKKTPDAQYIKVLLAYVDYGNDEYITVDLSKENHNLRVLKEEWLKLPAIAVQCTHFGLNFVSEDNELLASKLNEIHYKAVVARIKKINDGNNLVAEVYKDKTCEELCYADLIKQGFYQFKETTN